MVKMENSKNEIIPTIMLTMIPVRPFFLADFNITQNFILNLNDCAAIPYMPVNKKMKTRPAIKNNIDTIPMLIKNGMKYVILAKTIFHPIFN